MEKLVTIVVFVIVIYVIWTIVKSIIINMMYKYPLRWFIFVAGLIFIAMLIAMIHVVYFYKGGIDSPLHPINKAEIEQLTQFLN